MIPKTETKKKTNPRSLPKNKGSGVTVVRAGREYKRDFVMVTFGMRDQAVIDDLKKKASELGWTHSTLAREIIRKYLGYPTYF